MYDIFDVKRIEKNNDGRPIQTKSSAQLLHIQFGNVFLLCVNDVWNGINPLHTRSRSISGLTLSIRHPRTCLCARSVSSLVVISSSPPSVSLPSLFELLSEHASIAIDLIYFSLCQPRQCDRRLSSRSPTAQKSSSYKPPPLPK